LKNIKTLAAASMPAASLDAAGMYAQQQLAASNYD